VELRFRFTSDFTNDNILIIIGNERARKVGKRLGPKIVG
jgi:hypothetical protein